MTPGTYTDFLKSIFEELKEIKTTQAIMARQIAAIYNDDELPPMHNVPDEEISMEERIKQYGQKVPYNLINDPVEVVKFKEFLYESKKNGGQLNQLERDLLDIADKNFDDIRLSSKHLSVLKTIHQKLFGRIWPFKYKQGYMYKLEGYQPEWVFFNADGSELSP
jgi:hypothetical protein